MLKLYKDNRTVDFYEAKARIIDLLKNGWCRYSLGKNDLGRAINDVMWIKGNTCIKSVCLTGAIERANIENRLSIKFTRKIAAKIRRKYRNKVDKNSPVIDFNDYTAKNVDEVIDIVKQVKE